MTREERQAHRHARELLTCRHFNGVGFGGDAKCCRAGIDYRAHVGGEDFGWVKRLPCMPKPADEDRSRVVACSLREFPTEKEVEAQEREADESMALTTAAIKLCRADAGGKRGVAGDVECPKCTARLHYTVAKVNGHLWGRCSTDGCLAWMM